MNHGVSALRENSPMMRQSCREVRDRIAYVINNRTHIGLRQLDILFPCGKRLMQIKDWLVAIKTQLIEEWDR